MLKAERLLETYLGVVPSAWSLFRLRFRPGSARRGTFQRSSAKKLGRNYKGPVLFTEHHESHAASAFFPSPFNEAVIITADGVGGMADYNDRYRLRQQH